MHCAIALFALLATPAWASEKVVDRFSLNKKGRSLYEASLQELAEANPMRKIIGMLQDMQKELEREQEMEEELFEKAMCACEGGEKQLQKVIEDSTLQIEQLSSKVESETAERAQLTQEVKEHGETLAAAKVDLEQAQALRNKENRQFLKTVNEQKRNVDQLGKAIPALQAGMSSTAFMQQDDSPRLRRMIEVTRYLQPDTRANVLSFLDQGLGEDEQLGESSKTMGAGEIVGILKNMHDEMSKDLKEMQETEKRDASSFGELKAAKQQEISMNEKSTITKEKRAGALALTLSEDKHALEDTQEELKDAQNFISTMSETCERKKKERAARAKMRSEEIAAISEAIKILNDDDALDVFKKAIPSASLLTMKKQTFDALLQVTTEGNRLARKPLPKLNLLLLNIHQHGKEPEGVAAHAGAAENMVKGMIDGMVGVLHDEDVGDEHKKDWCANETQIAHDIQASKQQLFAQTESEISEMTDQVSTLVDEIKALGDQIDATDKLVHTSTEQRKTEHQEFVDTFSTMATATRLIDKAMTRLHKFYNPEKFAKEAEAVKADALAKAGLSLLHTKAVPKTAAVQRMLALGGSFDALIQTGRQSKVEPVAIPETPTTYEKKESGGGMGLMQDFKSDLQMDMTEAETEEKFAAKDYTRIMSEAQIARAGDVKSKNQKQSTKASLESKLIDAKALKQATDKELHNIELYLVQLKAECGFLLRNFEVRHEGRVNEEQGLGDAETIITNDEPPSHGEVEKKYAEEDSAKEVDENWPGKFGAEKF